MCLLSAVLNSIFVVGRNGRSPDLSTDNSKQAGLQFANFVVSFCFALAFGAFTGFLLHKINSLND